MNKHITTRIRNTALSAVALATLMACSSVPKENAMLEQARSDYRTASGNMQTQSLAPTELKQAADTLAQADAALTRGDETRDVEQLAYLARQRVALAQETATRKAAEASVVQANAERDRMRLAARTMEADKATQAAQMATRDAQNSQRQSEASQRQSEAARRDSEAAQRQAQSAQQQAMTAQQQAAAAQAQAQEAEQRSKALEKQLAELNAKKTERGMVITIGDLLFDTGRAELKPGGMQNIQRISGFLKEYPKRRAAIEGYTDSVGSEDMNQALSGRRAEAVRNALLNMGVDRAQLDAQGYGETYPVAGNDSSGGRQMNRRVEIVLSDEGGVVKPR